MPAKNLVIGFCTNMDLDRVLVFCRSIRAAHPTAATEIVLITDEPGRYAEPLRGLDVSFHPTPCDWKPATRKTEKLVKRSCVHAGRWLADGLFDRKVCGGAVSRFLPLMMEAGSHPMSARWQGYASALKSRPYAERALLTDVKDVIVQGDCFGAVADGRVQLFEVGKTVAEERWTSAWIRDGFGEEAARAIGGVHYACMGTVLGAAAATARFVDLVGSMFRRYPYRTVDQGLINWLLFKEGEPDYLERVPNLVGAVATLSRDGADAVEFRDGRIVRRADGSTVPVVHMWDRWPTLRDAVLEAYGVAPAVAAVDPPSEALDGALAARACRIAGHS